MKKHLVSLLCCISLIVFVRPVFADYVLPYPSFMPGNKMYRVSRVIDKLKNYWYWGTIAQIKYRLNLSDKYLVEAKTLFEYKQYLLATDAITRSDDAITGIASLIAKGENEGKNMNLQKSTILDAMKIHVLTIDRMKQELPSEFQWTPEKEQSTNLQIGKTLDASEHIRKVVLEKMEK